MKDQIRTFVAVELSEDVRRGAAELIDVLRTASADVKWVEPHNLHLTLKFLDDVPLTQIPQVCTAVARAAAAVEPFLLEVLGAGAFPNADRPRTIWLGTGQGQSQMGQLHASLEEELSALGFRKEHRRFQPHLTLGRVRRPGPALRRLSDMLWQHRDYKAGTLEVAEVVVFSSRLERTGPIYEALGRSTLGGID